MTHGDDIDPLSEIVFVLDRPQDVINVGAVVRLLGNFGLSRLRLVEPAAFDPACILTIARRGNAVLTRTERHSNLESALSDCAFVLGTTKRTRALDRPVLTPRQAAPALLAVAAAGVAQAAGGGRLAAVLFGPEDFGLSNDALDRCHAILQIPSIPQDASLNLAQAALLVAYELRLSALSLTSDSTAESSAMAADASVFLKAVVTEKRLAIGDETEAMFTALRRMLWALNPENVEGRVLTTMARLRALLLRAVPRADEAVLLTRLFDHIAHLSKSKET